MNKWLIRSLCVLAGILGALAWFMWPEAMLRPDSEYQELLGVYQDVSDLGLLARVVWGESRGEPLAGQVAVASVVLNRVTASGDPIREVILRPKQFSCFNPGDPNRDKLLAPSGVQWNVALLIGELALDGLLLDPTEGATHYHAVWMGRKPKWAGSLTEVGRLGSHVFYR